MSYSLCTFFTVVKICGSTIFTFETWRVIRKFYVMPTLKLHEKNKTSLVIFLVKV